MEDIVHPKGKIYYTMGEVSEMFDVRPSLLRYWEQEFDVVKPHRNKKGNRLYTPKDVDNIKVIYHLLKEKKMKIEVARKYLKSHKSEADRDAQIVERLMSIRAILQEIKNDLTYEGETIDEEFDEVPTCVNATTEEKSSSGTSKSNAKKQKAAGEIRAEKQPESLFPPFEEQVLFTVNAVETSVEEVEEGFCEDHPARSELYANGDQDEEKQRPIIIEQTLF